MNDPILPPVWSHAWGGARPPRWLSLLLALALLLGAAAAHLGGGAPEPLPVYALTAQGGVVDAQGEGPDAALRIARGAALRLILRPAAAVEGVVVLRAFRVRDGQARRLAAPFGRLEGGGFQLRAPSDVLELRPGRWDLVLLLGRPDALPADPHELPTRSGGLGWQRLQVALNVI